MLRKLYVPDVSEHVRVKRDRLHPAQEIVFPVLGDWVLMITCDIRLPLEFKA